MIIVLLLLVLVQPVHADPSSLRVPTVQMREWARKQAQAFARWECPVQMGEDEKFWLRDSIRKDGTEVLTALHNVFVGDRTVRSVVQRSVYFTEVKDGVPVYSSAVKVTDAITFVIRDTKTNQVVQFLIGGPEGCVKNPHLESYKKK